MNIIRVGKQEIVTPVVIISSEADLKIVTPVDIILKGMRRRTNNFTSLMNFVLIPTYNRLNINHSTILTLIFSR